MLRVVLIGDSIRMGYQDHVRQALRGQAEVLSPAENGGTSANVLAHLEPWVIAERPNVVHLNCGLHDLRREFDAQTNAVPLEQYEKNLARIIARVKAETDATLIWATTTPVNEDLHHRHKSFDRFEADVEAYNRVARRLAEQSGLPINDLNAVIASAGRDRLLLTDGVHFTHEGYVLLGEAVAATIKASL
jgi:lysophospholipase L1-like esterase